MTRTKEQLEALRRYRDQVREMVPRELDLPELNVTLGEDARASNDARLMKHFFQMIEGHFLHWQHAMSLSTLMALDGYLTMADTLNALGIYLMGRSLLELDGITTFTVSELRRLADPKKFNWRERGRKTFALLIRARTATGDPDIRSKLDAAGVPSVKVIHVNDGIRALEADEKGWAKAHYDFLSDYAHPNFGSRKTGIAGGHHASVVKLGKGIISLKSMAGITTYRYPAAQAVEEALSSTCERALESAQHIVAGLTSVPPPFAEEELLAITGTRSGAPEPVLRADDAALRHAVFGSLRAGRNDPCPCGSGKKFKKCHGWNTH